MVTFPEFTPLPVVLLCGFKTRIEVVNTKIISPRAVAIALIISGMNPPVYRIGNMRVIPFRRSQPID